MRKPIRYVLRSWHALAAPAKTLKPVVERLNLALMATINSAEVKKKLAELNVDAQSSTEAQAAELLAREIRHWAEVMRQARTAQQ